METNGKTIFVIGGTGTQGGAVSRHLNAAGWQVRTITRDLSKPVVQELRDAGIEVLEGNMDDPASLDRAMEGVYGVFSLQQFWEVGAEGEIRQGINVGDAAVRAGVKHFVYSSVGGAERKSGLPHFECKWVVENHLRSLDIPLTIIRPVFFMDNFGSFSPPSEEEGTLVFRAALPPDRPLQMIAADDIGGIVAKIFADPEKYIGVEIEIAGDELTFPQVAERFSEATGKPARFEELPLETVMGFSQEVGLMYKWFDEHGYTADIDAVREIYPQLRSMKTWLTAPKQELPVPEKQGAE